MFGRRFIGLYFKNGAVCFSKFQMKDENSRSGAFSGQWLSMPAGVSPHSKKPLSEAPETMPSEHANPCDQMRFWKLYTGG